VTDDRRPRSPDRLPAETRPEEPRTAEAREADHAAIGRLADDLVPALIAKLSASGLGEIEVAEEAWTIRVRRPADPTVGQGRRLTDRSTRTPGGHGHVASGFEGHRAVRETRPASGGLHASSNGSGPAGHDPDPPAGASHRPADDADPHRVVATSPAVGVSQPGSAAKPGTRVRNGDRLGAVDMLGVPQEVVAPADGILGASLVEAGQAVEYGQELIVIELAGRPAERSEA
jgi:biotin carboxyl carrier protein